MRLAWLVASALAACAAVGCSAGTKAGGRPLPHPIVLSIANHETEGRDLAEYIAAVDGLSQGSIQLERHEGWRSALADYDRATLADVRAGRIDLAKIAVRSLDTVGVTDFQALTAPFLVDSIALERTVLASPLGDEMLAGLARTGVVGVAVVPGEPRRPFGQRRRFVAPSAYRGALFGIGPSRLSRETLEALGAKPRTYVAGQLPYAFDGAELDLATIEGQGDATSVTTLTGNVVLWPRAFVIVANRKVFASLTTQQRETLRDAGREALGPATRRLRIEERDEAGILCRRDHATLLQATSRELAELRAAVRPVYATLERSAITRARIRQIESMKRRLPPETAVRCGLPGAARQRSTTPLDGTWEMTADARYGIDGGRYRLVLRHGRWRFNHLSAPKWGGLGVFSVRGGDTLRVHFSDGSDAIYRWNVFRETLTLLYTSEHVGAPNPTYAPWHRVGR
jgi:TRAP-type C4-dicarboxylate transport system substrate-binding protein